MGFSEQINIKFYFLPVWIDRIIYEIPNICQLGKSPYRIGTEIRRRYMEQEVKFNTADARF